MEGEVKLVKTTQDGRLIFCKDGVYIALTKKQVDEMKRLANEEEKS